MHSSDFGSGVEYVTYNSHVSNKNKKILLKLIVNVSTVLNILIFYIGVARRALLGALLGGNSPQESKIGRAPKTLPKTGRSYSACTFRVFA